MCGFDCLGIGNQNVVIALPDILLGGGADRISRISGIVNGQYGTCHKRVSEHGVDFIESQPVFDLALVAVEYGRHIIVPETDQLRIGPATVFCQKMQRCLIMGKCDHRLHAVLMHFIKQSVIECKAGFIGFTLIPVREDSSPGDGCAETVESHACHQFQIFGIAVIEIYSLMGKIFEIGIKRHFIFAAFLIPADARMAGTDSDHDVCHIGFLAVSQPCAFELIGRDSSAP